MHIKQALLASVVMVGVMVSEEGSLSVDALSVLTFQFWIWLLWRRVRMICPDWQTLKNLGWEVPKGLPRLGSSSTLERMTMLGGMSTPIAEHSQTKRVRFLSILLFVGSSILECWLCCYGVAGKEVSKAPKIQRLVTPLTLQRKRARIADKKKRIAKAKSEAADYQKLLASRLKEQRERRSESLAKKRSRLSAASKPSIAA